MKKIIFALLILLGNIEAGHYSQFSYPKSDPAKIGYILGNGEHELRGKGNDGIIEIEDGTQFKAIPHHRYAMKDWNFHDPISFCPNYYPFGGSEFYVVNERNRQYFKANIWASASIDNPHTLHLAEVDRVYKNIILSNNEGMRMRWDIDPRHFERLLKYWQIGDVIVIGKCNHWLSHHQYILVSYSATEDILYVYGTPQPL